MANIGAFIEGAYNGAYNSVAIGPTENGFKLSKTMSARMVEKSDVYADMLIDGFYAGGSCKLACDAQEYKAGTIAPFWPFGGMGTVFSTAIPAGRRLSDLASSMVLTSTANTPAASAPASLTGAFSIMAPGQTVELDFDTKLRTVPIVLQLLPYTSGGNTIWFTLT